MKKIIVLNVPSYGHINPTLPVVGELVKRGYSVTFYAIEEFREKIEATGAIYREYKQYEAFDMRVGRNEILLFQKLLEVSNKHLPELFREVEQERPDLILHDAQFLPGKIIAKKLSIPVISFSSMFVLMSAIRNAYPRLVATQIGKLLLQPHRVWHFLGLYRQLSKKYGLRTRDITDLLMNKEGLNIVFTSSYFQPQVTYLDNTYCFVGPSIISRGERKDMLKNLPKNKKIIYLALGTIYNDDLDFYKLCIQALAKTPYHIVISLGHRFSLSELGLVPYNVTVNNHIPQLEILQQASLFISHGGMNSTNESLYYGVPMLIVPQMDEQRLNALRVQELDAGVYLERKRITQHLLLKTVENMLNTTSFYTHAAKVGKTLKDAGGYKKAADEIEKYLKKHQKKN